MLTMTKHVASCMPVVGNSFNSVRLVQLENALERLSRVVDERLNEVAATQDRTRQLEQRLHEKDREIRRLQGQVAALTEELRTISGRVDGNDACLAIINCHIKLQDCLVENVRLHVETYKEQLGGHVEMWRRLVPVEFTTMSEPKQCVLLDLFRAMTDFPGFEPSEASVRAVFEQSFRPEEFFKAIRDCPNVVVVAVTAENKFFGVSLTKPVTSLEVKVYDPSISVFTYDPHRDDKFEAFGVCDAEKKGVFVRCSSCSRSGVLCVGSNSGQLWIGSELQDSFCANLSGVFEGLDDRLLTGHSGRGEDEIYHCSKVIVLQIAEKELSHESDDD